MLLQVLREPQPDAGSFVRSPKKPRPGEEVWWSPIKRGARRTSVVFLENGLGYASSKDFTCSPPSCGFFFSTLLISHRSVSKYIYIYIPYIIWTQVH